MVLARMEAAKAWCGEKTSTKVMDPELAEEFAQILVVHMYEPHLGCAKTSEMLAEVQARSRESATIDAEDERLSTELPRVEP